MEDAEKFNSKFKIQKMFHAKAQRRQEEDRQDNRIDRRMSGTAGPMVSFTKNIEPLTYVGGFDTRASGDY